MEIWKDIEGYEGIYKASNKGRIKSLQRYNKKGIEICEKIMKPCVDRYGYSLVCLYNNTSKRSIRVHRIIALTFIPNPNSYKEINHKDENKNNNSLENLEWCTRRYNLCYGSRKLVNKKRGKVVYQYNKNKELIHKWESIREAEKTGLYTESGIRQCTSGRQQQYKGFIWSFKEL